MTLGIGDSFQQETKYHRDRMRGGPLDWQNQPEPYKEYPGSRRVELPGASPAAPGASLHEALTKRKSIRQFSGEPLPLEQLSYLLWASTGIQRRERGIEFRTAPSAGALYPVETYLAVNNVADLPNGLYHYPVAAHVLEELRPGDVGPGAAEAALDQEMCAQAAVTFIWTGIFQRSKWKYKQRAYRYVYFDAGHVAENLALAAAALGLGACHVAAIYDDEANALLGVDGAEESVIYMTAVGVPA